MKGQWVLKEVYFEDGWPSVIRDPIKTKDYKMTDAEFMQIWRGIKAPSKEIEMKVLDYGHKIESAVWQQFYNMGKQEMKPVLQQALSALDSAYYILKIQPVTPEQEADTVALAIQSVTTALEKLG
jgi:hypothetical protein